MELSIIIWSVAAMILIAAFADMTVWIVKKMKIARKEIITIGSEREEFYIPGDEPDQYDSEDEDCDF